MSKNQQLEELDIYFKEWEKNIINNKYYNESTKDYLLNYKKNFVYNWSKLAIQNGMSIKEIKEIEKYIDYFYNETYDGHVIRTFNGFTGVGILEIPSDHGDSKGVNTIKIFICGHNENKTGIEEQVNIYLTLDELEDFNKCINVCIKKFKEYK